MNLFICLNLCLSAVTLEDDKLVVWLGFTLIEVFVFQHFSMLLTHVSDNIVMVIVIMGETVHDTHLNIT